MNSRQRRGIILLVLSVVCAIAAFAGVVSVINDVESKVGPEQAAYELKDDVDAYTKLDAGQFRKVSMPKRWIPSTAVRDLDEINGRIAATNLKKGSLLQKDMTADVPDLRPGQLEIAIMIDAETGVAGKIRPGDTVNIFATFAADNQGGRADANGTRASSQIIVSNARIIHVGDTKSLEPDRDKVRRSSQGVAITFALSPMDAQRVAYAESFATHVRLALVAPGDKTALKPGERTYTLDQDQ
ncbi:Flp pilus assembly protein CpaB [Wenjunlia tyrosinilytica]|jgi:pilus assembly protein CpaB|uniref:Flp pilus assembly protein CpaB n=1 Tax=Wenjunlia tyrosinilytica TaxID=1544741 RepID=A0A918E0L2_9ACTN|nr:Flp pilus assembly protein CpaB [Wenjunlia tyrosinilytica]GGO97528.1 Flp pilus assembly protein CpaB [Wenjunlia tyrosinilytica]